MAGVEHYTVGGRQIGAADAIPVYVVIHAGAAQCMGTH